MSVTTAIAVHQDVQCCHHRPMAVKISTAEFTAVSRASPQGRDRRKYSRHRRLSVRSAGSALLCAYANGSDFIREKGLFVCRCELILRAATTKSTRTTTCWQWLYSLDSNDDRSPARFMAGRFGYFGRTFSGWRGRSGVWQWKPSPGVWQWRSWMSGIKSVAGKRWVPVVIVLMGLVSFLHGITERSPVLTSQNVEHHLWNPAPSFGWQASCAQRSLEWLPPRKSNGYLVVRCNGGFDQQHSAICNAVLAARIMNATLVLPQLDSNLFWKDESGFPGIYDVDHFITSLKNDVRVVRSLPTTWAGDHNNSKLESFQLSPPHDASLAWYETIALEKMKEHGAIYLSPFSHHHLTQELDNHEYQRLRCRVNYHALRFTNEVRNLSTLIVERLRSEGPYMSIHLHFGTDMSAFTGCLDIFNSTEQEALKESGRELEPSHRQPSGKCPLTPKEVGLFLHALGFDNSTRIYVAGGLALGGQRFLDPLQDLFPLLETQLTVAMPEELLLVNAGGRGYLGPAIDYLVCLLSEIFVLTYDDPSNFGNNLIGQRLYYGFRTTFRLDQKTLAQLFHGWESGLLENLDFETSVKKVMRGMSSGSPHTRMPLESFYTNPWPECFCTTSPNNTANRCPSKATRSLSYDNDEDDSLAGWNV